MIKESLIIKERLLINGIWETLILNTGEARVYIQKLKLYSYSDFLDELDALKTIYTPDQIQCLEDIFLKYGKNLFSRQDMIDFANHLYKDVADLPGHEADERYLNDWIYLQTKN